MASTVGGAAFRSISFSGAGFLGCYHVGVAACLLHHGHLLPRGELPSTKTPLLTGVSAGSLVASGVSAGVDPEDAMEIVLEVGRKTKELGGIMDCLRPGFSLIDQVNNLILRYTKEALGGTPGNDFNDYDRDLFHGRIQGGRLLRIGLTHRKLYSSPARRLEAYVYTDGYRDVEDMVAASILSSYLPGLTGPAKGCNHEELLAVKRATKRIMEMEAMGYIKRNTTGQPIQLDKNDNNGNDSRELYWDGGLVNVWPTIDDTTLVVTPISGDFDPNPYICPELNTDDNRTSVSSLGSLLPESVEVRDGVKIYTCLENLDTLWRMILSSPSEILQAKFSQGYDDATRFLDQNNVQSVYSTTAHH